MCQNHYQILPIDRPQTRLVIGSNMVAGLFVTSHATAHLARSREGVCLMNMRAFNNRRLD